MQALDLELLRTRRRSWPAYTLAAFAIAFTADAAIHYRDLREEVEAKEVRAARRAARPAVEAGPALSADERTFARETLRRLTTPWNSLFRALEAVQTDNVALLTVEPDIENRTVSISGEAKDYLAALTYLARLAEQPGLSRVHLVRHETRPGSQRPMAFQISASWKEQR
jgi:hypothetical protein